jgi:hypothetical protein
MAKSRFVQLGGFGANLGSTRAFSFLPSVFLLALFDLSLLPTVAD